MKSGNFIREKNDFEITNEILKYGIIQAAEFIASIVTIMVLGILFSLFKEIVSFFISFYCIRVYAGGYHYKNAINCYITSTIIILGVILIIKNINPLNMLNFSILLIIFSVPVIVILSPLETSTRPLEKIEKIHFKKILLRNLLIEMIAVILLINFKIYTIVLAISLGLSVISILLILQKIILLKSEVCN